MSIRTTQFAPENYYHIYNRGVDKRKIFTNKRDFERFYISLYLLNDESYHPPTGLYFTSPGDVKKEGQTRTPLVNILSFCLIPNHFHMLIEPVVENGLTKFMHRLLMGYAKYFNKKYDRTGPLYDGAFKAIQISNEAHFEHLLRYIHLNALDLTDMQWREGAITDWNHAVEFLDEYQWSSHHAYRGAEQLLPVVEKGVLGDIFSTPQEYHNFLRQWSMRSMGDVREILHHPEM
ncbi:transposase [Candidatus Uhrbacteria bacterium]|nr:transposase [Candidatus Uhrbacteria bacterium]